jgi:hypothetical protein
MGYKPRPYQRLGYRKLETNRLYEVWRKGKHTYVEWTPTPQPGFNRKSLRAWGEDIAAFSGIRPHAYANAISHIKSTYGMESKYVHHVGYSRGGAFARELGGTGYGTFNMRTETQARGSTGHKVDGADFVHNRLVTAGNFLTRGYLKRKEYAPSSESAQGDNKRPRVDSLIPARPARDMSSGDAKYGGRFSRRVRRAPRGSAFCTRRLVQEYGSINATNIVYHVYPHHANREHVLNEFCRSLVVKLVHTMKGTVKSHDAPICWPFPKSEAGDTDYLANIRIHYRDLAPADIAGTADGVLPQNIMATYGNNFGTLTAARYRADYDDALPPMFPISLFHETAISAVTSGEGIRLAAAQFSNKSLVDLAKDLQAQFKYIFEHARHRVPCRLQITRKMGDNEEVVYDDDNFAAASTKLTVTANHKLMNVSPAAGNSMAGVDGGGGHNKNNLMHTPLIGRLYEFSGDCPIVRDKHPKELHQLFPLDKILEGRYTIDGQSVHDPADPTKTSIMHHPPAGTNLFKNCNGTSYIKMQPGQIKKLLIKMNLTTTLGSLSNRWRQSMTSRMSLGGCTMLALHPMVRYDPALAPDSSAGLKGDVIMLRSHTNTHYSAVTTFRRRPYTLLSTDISLVRVTPRVRHGAAETIDDIAAFALDGPTSMDTGGTAPTG